MSKCIVCKTTRANFNYKDRLKAKYCSKCKLTNMVDVVHKKCLICKVKQPIYNYIEEITPSHCNNCKLDDMVDVISKKCLHCNFNYVNRKYNPYCFTCYIFLNPNSEIVRNYKIKENTIMRFVKEKFENCVLDSIISGGCSKRRPDGLIEYELFSIIIEIDEDSHKSYEDICENKRLMEIYRDLNFKPLRLIRFNPDSYKDINGKRINSIFSLDSNKKLKVKNKKELNQRVNILLNTIEKTIENTNKEIILDINNVKSIDLEYLFFDEN